MIRHRENNRDFALIVYFIILFSYAQRRIIDRKKFPRNPVIMVNRERSRVSLFFLIIFVFFFFFFILQGSKDLSSNEIEKLACREKKGDVYKEL